jgi:hydroxymethylpyrimidine pyrophosphatase-like HAD family hydrolase/energy-coupling factor transporter ATP-binding protein EcfA2
MRYLALACDYDGTLAAEGRVTPQTIEALERLLASGRQLILVTGRVLEDLFAVFPHTHLFSRVVAENGAVLYRPANQEVKLLSTPPPQEFIQALQARGVEPLSTGQVIVATWHPQEIGVLSVIRELGLELQVIFNKGAVMVLPTGVNKATGLTAALAELGLSPHNVMGVGDAENDHAFLQLCECSVAVANALPMLQERVDLVTSADHGAGVVELIDRLLASDLNELESRLSRHHIWLGTRPDGQEVRLRPYGSNLLLAGTSGSGKSTLATGFFEGLMEHGYQFCIIDPEGDYETLEGAVVLGNHQRSPTVTEVLQLLQDPSQNVVVNLLGLALEERPAYFAGLLARVQELRIQTGRPHWVVVDEAHHLLPVSWQPAALTLTSALQGMLLITVHPDQVAPAILAFVDTVIAVGEAPERTLAAFAETVGQPAPALAPVALEPGEALIWQRHSAMPPSRFWSIRGRAERRRHQRKYAEGELGPDKSFYFRGPEDKLNLRAQNLILFLQLADGVDDATWLYHLHQGDYSRWFREAIKDEGLAADAAQVEALVGVSPSDSRARIRAAIEQRYTLPSAVP